MGDGPVLWRLAGGGESVISITSSSESFEVTLALTDVLRNWGRLGTADEGDAGDDWRRKKLLMEGLSSALLGRSLTGPSHLASCRRYSAPGLRRGLSSDPDRDNKYDRCSEQSLGYIPGVPLLPRLTVFPEMT